MRRFPERFPIENYLNLPRAVALRLWPSLPPGLDIEDLVQAGSIGLLEAARRFDHSKGVKFQNYAWPRIEGAIRDSLRTDGLHKRVPPGRERPRFAVESESHDGRLIGNGGGEGKGVRTGYFSLIADPRALDPTRYAAVHDDLEQSCQALRLTDRVTFFLHEGFGLLLREIGLVLGVSESRACQYLARAKARLGRLSPTGKIMATSARSFR